MRSSASLLEKTSMLLSRNWKETSRLFGPAGANGGIGKRISDQMDWTGAQLAVVTGAAHLGDEGQGPGSWGESVSLHRLAPSDSSFR